MNEQRMKAIINEIIRGQGLGFTQINSTPSCQWAQDNGIPNRIYRNIKELLKRGGIKGLFGKEKRKKTLAIINELVAMWNDCTEEITKAKIQNRMMNSLTVIEDKISKLKISGQDFARAIVSYIDDTAYQSNSTLESRNEGLEKYTDLIGKPVTYDQVFDILQWMKEEIAETILDVSSVEAKAIAEEIKKQIEVIRGRIIAGLEVRSEQELTRINVAISRWKTLNYSVAKGRLGKEPVAIINDDLNATLEYNSLIGDCRQAICNIETLDLTNTIELAKAEALVKAEKSAFEELEKKRKKDEIDETDFSIKSAAIKRKITTAKNSALSLRRLNEFRVSLIDKLLEVVNGFVNCITISAISVTEKVSILRRVDIAKITGLAGASVEVLQSQLTTLLTTVEAEKARLGVVDNNLDMAITSLREALGITEEDLLEEEKKEVVVEKEVEEEVEEVETENEKEGLEIK